MFSKLTAFLHQAAVEVTNQVLARQLTRSEEFQAHWKAITDAVTAENEVDCTVMSTGISSHLDKMVELLCLEEEEIDSRDPGTVGPCMEFVLRHKILFTIFSTAKADYPAGMQKQVLLFFTLLLGRIERRILHHVNIHQPVLLQVKACGMTPSFAADEVQFLRALCLRLARDPGLADFFIMDASSPPHAPPSLQRRQFVLAEALICLANTTPDYLVALKAYECLLSCVAIPHSAVCQTLAGSQLPVLLASKLQHHFQLVPPNTRHTAVLGCQAGWGVDYALRGATADHSPCSHGTWHVEALLSWLDYCEQVVASSPPQEELADAVCSAIAEIFLSASLLPKLAKSNEDDIVLSTAVLTRCLQAISCPRLLQEFVEFTLGATPLPGSDHTHLKETLIRRTDHISSEVCQVTLQLFDVLLQSPLTFVLNELVLSAWPHPSRPRVPLPIEKAAQERRNLEDTVKSYLSVVPETLTSCRQVMGEVGIEQYLIEAHLQVARYRALSVDWNTPSSSQVRETDPHTLSPPLTSSALPIPHTLSPPLSSSSQHRTTDHPSTDAPLLPSADDPGSSLLAESPIIIKKKMAGSTPKMADPSGCVGVVLTPGAVETDGGDIMTKQSISATSTPVGKGCGHTGGGRSQLHETAFLKAVLNKLETLLDQPYEVNLLLSSIVASLAAVPHPLMKQLFEPHTTQGRNVFTILRKVSAELQTHAERTPGLAVNLVQARRRLAGLETSDLLSMPHNDLLEGAIVLEEFTKELAAVLFAKTASAILTLPSPFH